MGFGGSTSGANVIMKNNRRPRKSKTDKYQKVTGSGLQGIGTEKSDPEKLKEISQRLQLQNKKRQQKLLLILAVLGVSILLIFFFLLS
ncbi:hypothetical protein ACW6QP_13580 [Salegentibacter sp. HM20]